MKKTLLERFLAKVNKTDTCWLWTGALHPDGYGQFKYEGKCRRAHVVAYILFKGPVPEGLELDHTCKEGS